MDPHTMISEFDAAQALKEQIAALEEAVKELMERDEKISAIIARYFGEHV